MYTPSLFTECVLTRMQSSGHRYKGKEQLVYVKCVYEKCGSIFKVPSAIIIFDIMKSLSSNLKNIQRFA